MDSILIYVAICRIVSEYFSESILGYFHIDFESDAFEDRIVIRIDK